MINAAGRRAFSFLANKIHPQLPLSPRESEQLLGLLTTSFRAQLDRAHGSPNHGGAQMPRDRSHSLTNEHMDSILTNPLLAPRVPARTGAQDALRDPLGWFLGQVAMGAADVQKAWVCLDLLHRAPQSSQTKAASQIANWLWSSGLENTNEFVSAPRTFQERLVQLLVRDKDESPVWRWILSCPHDFAKNTKMPLDQVLRFKGLVIRAMLFSKLTNPRQIDSALATFLQIRMKLHQSERDTTVRRLQRAGELLVSYIAAHPDAPVSTDAYNAFQESVPEWSGSSLTLTQCLLALHHPSKPTALPTIDLVQNVDGGAEAFLQPLTQKQRKLLVTLCLGAARRLLDEKHFDGARKVLHFTKEAFPELAEEPLETVVPSEKIETPQQPSQTSIEEEKNLRLLDGLLLG